MKRISVILVLSLALYGCAGSVKFDEPLQTKDDPEVVVIGCEELRARGGAC